MASLATASASASGTGAGAGTGTGAEAEAGTAAQTSDDWDVGPSEGRPRPLEQPQKLNQAPDPGTPGHLETAAAARTNASSTSTSTCASTSTSTSDTVVRSTTGDASTAAAGAIAPSPHTSDFLHEHRVHHNPSKLPTFRFGDCLLQNKPRPGHPSLVVSPGPPAGPAGINSTSLLVETAHHHHPQNTTANPENSSHCPQTLQASALPAPPSPALLTPVTEADEYQSADAGDSEPVSNHHPQDHTSADSPHSIPSPDEHSPRSRASTYQTASTSAPITPTTAKRSVSIAIDENTVARPADNSSPAAPASQTDTESSCFYTPATHPRTRRAHSVSHWTSTSSPLASRGAKETHSPGNATREWAHGQRGFISPKSVNGTHSDEAEKIPRRRSSTSRPPLSYRPPPPGISTPGRIPPIRSFRSSGSRKSSLPDMSNSSNRYYDEGDDYRDPNERDRSLRALEGRRSNDWSRDVAPPDADDEITESENNTADIFMRIAREDSSSSIPRRNIDQGDQEEQNGTVSRVVRTARASRQRPASGIYSSTSSIQNPPSPPSASRRLSDHQVPTSRTIRRVPDDQPEPQALRDVSYHSSVIGRPSLKLDSARASSRVATLKPSPITPRTQSVLDYSGDRNSIVARRPSSKAGDGHSRSSSLRQPTNLSKSFNSSPLVPKTGESQHAVGGQHEASESSNSTAAPSTVWDELDELKSRIHRLELTGKMPKTSGAAISRTSDERPPTAGTGATTISGSPKRAQTEVISTTSSQKEAQPILRSALSKTKPFVGPEVYDAIEAAANDALSLSLLMGTAGQPGPISSGASTIGIGGSSTVTDRQLRKKADSICRSLTELCLALTEENSQRRTASTSRPQTRGTSTTRDDERPGSPPAMRVFTGRQSAGPDEPLSSIEPFSSPRATRLEKRATFNFTGVGGASNAPSPRYASSVVGGDDTMTGRKSSLVISRARRGVTEEPDDQGRKTSLLRTRRANTEEPEENEGNHSRRSSLVLPPRRVTTISRVSNIDEEPQAGSRAPSRAITEVSNGLRIAVPPRDSIARRPLAQEPASASSIQAPRRLLMSGLPTPGPYSSRLMTPTTPSARRFLQVTRQPQEREDTGEITARLGEDRGQRYSIGAPSSASIARGPSLHRKRHSGIPNISGTASNVGGYR